MMQLLATLLLGFSIFGGSVKSPDWPTVYRALKDSIKQIDIVSSDDHGSCSSIVVERTVLRTKLLTAAHCAGVSNTKLYIGKREAAIEKIAPHADIALISVEPDKNDKPLPMAFTVPEIGRSIATLGYAFGIVGALPMSVGHVVLSAPEHPLWVDAVAVQGDSGGAVVDEIGLLVGMIVREQNDQFGGTVGIAVPVDTLRKFLTQE